MKTAIIIPCYNPDEKLITLVRKLKYYEFEYIVIIDDGSQESCNAIFNSVSDCNCAVFHHNVNKGKGAAIKTAIEAINKYRPDIMGYVTADCDGQHSAEDIKKISMELENNNDAFILGTRSFNMEDIPLKSKFGNKFSSIFFKLSTGCTCNDTQTGLRGIPKSMSGLALSTEGNRYEYEMNFLIEAAKKKYKMISVPITTIYKDNNKGSHFRPVADSIRIYATPLKFAASSLICSIADLSVFTILFHFFKIPLPILAATVIARVCSGGLNFLLNKKWSFQKSGNIGIQSVRYLILFIFQMAASAFFVSIFSFIPISNTIIKIFVDGTLFVISYFIQRNWIFKQDYNTARRHSH